MYPFVLHFGSVAIPTFAVLAAVGLMLALALSERTARLAGVDPERLWNAGLFAVLAAFIVSRVLLVAFNLRAFRAVPLLFLAVPSLTSAGLLLTVVATLLWLYLHRIPVLRALDAWAPCGALVWCFLALGHFAEGSDPGMPFRHGFRMPGEQTPLHPVALYAATVAAALVVGLLGALRRSHRPGDTAGWAFVAAGVAQFLLSFVRQPAEVVSTLPLGLDPLQVVALLMLGAGGALVAFAPARVH